MLWTAQRNAGSDETFVVNNEDPSDPSMELVMPGAPDRAVEMGIEVIAKLPKGARLLIELPAAFAHRIGIRQPQIEIVDRDRARIALSPQGRQDLGAIPFAAKERVRARIIAEIPKENRKQDGWEVIVRQYLAKTREELGRVTWHFVSPEFFERRKRIEKCLGIR